MQFVPLTADIARRLERLFPQEPPVPIRLWAILDGVIQGRILADDPVQPKAAAIVDGSEGHAYLGGALTPQFLHAAFQRLRVFQELVVCLWPGDPLLSMLPGGHTYEGKAIDFSERSLDVDLERMAVFPPGFSLQRIDAAYTRAVPEFDYYVKMFGSSERALQSMIGYYLVQGEQIACEAVAAPLCRGVAELGVETAPAFQQKGLATALCAYLIRECEARGCQTFWNAAQQNTASVALARRLGFRHEQRMIVLAWPADVPRREIIEER
jgi:RimJ/RimL family protein N-acetyltransferase